MGRAGELRGLLDEKWIPEPNTGCWLWLGSLQKFGYGRIRVDGVEYAAHRFMWERARGSMPTEKCLLHKCDTPCCVNPDHMFIGTNYDNSRDALKKGRLKIGERHGMAKLTCIQVQEIRRRYAAGELQRDIAVAFTVTRPLISLIVNRKIWNDIND